MTKTSDTPKVSRTEQEIKDAVEAAREYLYRGGIHYQGSFNVFLGNPNTGLGGMLDLAEVLAFYALDQRDAGYRDAIRDAAEEVLRGPKGDGYPLRRAEELAAEIRKLGEK